MKMSSVKTVYDFMRYCRMPLWFQRSIRDMKVGDTFILGKYTQAISTYNHLINLSTPLSDSGGEPSFVAEAWIEKERGIYKFYATWTFPTKPERSMIMTFGNFKIIKGGFIVFDSESEAIINFAKVCRYLAKMLDCMTMDEKKEYFAANSSPLFNGIWLDSDHTERRERAVQVEGKIKRVLISYKNHQMTHQLAAIVDAGIALGSIPLSESMNVR